MKTRPGHRDDVVAILLSGADGLRQVGCDLYVVGVSKTDDVTIWVSEVWQSKEAHDASLQLPETRAAIGAAMPMLTGEFTGQEVTVLGGLGLG
jgi:quinol monooxygenase YgiN